MNKPARQPRKTIRIELSMAQEYWDAFAEGTGYSEAKIRQEIEESHRDTCDQIRDMFPESDPRIYVAFL